MPEDQGPSYALLMLGLTFVSSPIFLILFIIMLFFWGTVSNKNAREYKAAMATYLTQVLCHRCGAVYQLSSRHT